LEGDEIAWLWLWLFFLTGGCKVCNLLEWGFFLVGVSALKSDVRGKVQVQEEQRVLRFCFISGFANSWISAFLLSNPRQLKWSVD
jgi:hypothetical protein